MSESVAGRPQEGPISINKRVESRDLDGCLGYLSLVNGVNGAVVFSREGLVVAAGDDTHESLLIEGPYFLANFLETLRQCRTLGLGPLEQNVSFTENHFHQIINLEQSGLFFLIVSGTRGSHELFKFRIERGAQAIAHLLHERGYLRG